MQKPVKVRSFKDGQRSDKCHTVINYRKHKSAPVTFPKKKKLCKRRKIKTRSAVIERLTNLEGLFNFEVGRIIFNVGPNFLSLTLSVSGFRKYMSGLKDISNNEPSCGEYLNQIS